MIAYESQDRKQILNSILNTIEACAPEINAKTLSAYDIDYIFTKIRTKSVGEKATIIATCNECEHKNEIDVDLDGAYIDGDVKNNIIKITDEISIKMRYPSYYEMINNDIITSDNATGSEILNETVKLSIESVMTEEENISLRDESDEEIERFINSLKTEQFGKINDFILSVPKLKFNMNYVCESCNKTNEKVLEGRENFFS
jgi:hypothetical protein